MDFTISDRPDFRYEALCLLERLASHSGEASGMFSDFDAYCGHYLGELSLSGAEVAQIEALRDAGRRTAEKLDIGAEEMAQYFRLIPDTELSLAGALLMMESFFGNTQPDDAALVKAIISLFDIEPEEGCPATFQEMADAVAALRLPAEAKWACAELFLRYGSLRSRAMELIDDAARQLETEAAPLQAVVTACADALRGVQAAEGLETMFRARGLVLDVSDCYIYPCAMRFSAISLISTDCVPSGLERVIIRYGTLFDLLHERSEAQRSESDELLRYAKALADKTRVQILFALKDAPLYAQNVVSLTGLTAATVSHHMSELASVGLVALEKQGTRILYSLLPQKIERLVILLRALVI